MRKEAEPRVHRSRSKSADEIRRVNIKSGRFALERRALSEILLGASGTRLVVISGSPLQLPERIYSGCAAEGLNINVRREERRKEPYKMGERVLS